MSEFKTQFDALLNEMKSGMARVIFGYLNVPLDFSEQSLVLIEEKINEMYPLGHQPLLTTLIPFGYYLGETIIRNIPNAHWDASNAEDIFDVSVVIENPLAKDNQPQKSVVKPFLRVRKFWFDRTDGLAVLYRMVNLMNLNFIDTSNLKKGEWVELPNGDRFRLVDEIPKA
jgi:hypothetical protein